MMMTISNVLDGDALADIAQLLEQGDWMSGQHTAGRHAARHKTNLEMDQRCWQWKNINNRVVSALYNHPEFQRSALPHKVSAAFVARYRTGDAYGCHIDDPIMGSMDARYRSDIACTVFLSDSADYEGGELIIHTRNLRWSTQRPVCTRFRKSRQGSEPYACFGSKVWCEMRISAKYCQSLVMPEQHCSSSYPKRKSQNLLT